MAIYTGVWFDHATHKLILTLGPKAAGFLSAAIVTWVGLVAAATWTIFRFILYSARQHPSDMKDVFHHQRQAMLRNSSSAAGAAGQLLAMIFAYRSYKTRATPRSILYLISCAVIFLLWTICALYAPYVYTRTGSDVLLAESSNCGFAELDTTQDVGGNDAFTMFQKYELDTVASADAYVRQCYGNSTASAGCSTYQRPSITYSKGTAECPFGTNKDLCYTVNSTVLQLDTGLLSSNLDFGINARSSESLDWRHVATCSPIHASEYVSQLNVTGTPLADQYPPGEVLFNFMFGPTAGSGDNMNNATFTYTFYEQRYEQNYELTTETYFANNPDTADSAWFPNETFYAAQDADVTISFLSANRILYFDPVYDPVFAAGLDGNDTKILPGDNYTLYTSHSLINVLACTDQYQTCIPDSKLCTPLGPVESLENATATLLRANHALNIPRISVLGRLGISSSVSSVGVAPQRRGSSILLAPRTLNGVLQTASLPQNQWELEVENWFSIALAKMQAKMFSYANGPEDAALDRYVEPPVAASRHFACTTQRTRNMDDHVNFDLAALVVLVVVGFGLIVFGLLFETILAFVAQRTGLLRKRWMQYVLDGLYQIQRAAFEPRGVRNWKHTDGTLPTSAQGVEQGEVEELVGHESLLNVPK